MEEARVTFNQFVGQGAYDAAAAAIQAVIAECPGTEEAAEACLMLGHLQKTLGQYDAAINTLGEAVEHASDSAWAGEALTKIGDIYKDQGNLDGAIALYERVAKEYAHVEPGRRAVKADQRIEQLYRSTGQRLRLMAQRELMSQRYGARSEWYHVKEVRDVAFRTRRALQSQLERYETGRDSMMIAQAYGETADVYEDEPGVASMFRARIGRVHLSRGELAAAEAAFQDVVTRHENETEFFTLGHVIDARQGLAQIRQSQGDIGAARAIWTAVQARYSDNDAVVARSWLGIGNTYAAEEAYEDAVTAYLKVTPSLIRERFSALVEAGLCRIFQGQVEAGKGLWRQGFDEVSAQASGDDLRKLPWGTAGHNFARRFLAWNGVHYQHLVNPPPEESVRKSLYKPAIIVLREALGGFEYWNTHKKMISDEIGRLCEKLGGRELAIAWYEYLSDPESHSDPTQNLP